MTANNPIILFDGVCNFCNAIINFVIRQDKKAILRFAALQSEAGQTILKQYGVDWKKNDSFVLIENGKVYDRSTAALKLSNRLRWYWQWTQLFWIFPKSLRDGIYDFTAKNRYKWFGKKEKCMVPTPEVRQRFLV